MVALPLAFHVLGFVWASELATLLDLTLIGVKQFRVTGIFLSCLWQPPDGILSSVFTLLFGYMTLKTLPNLERSNGSGKMIMWITISTVVVNVCFLLMAFCLDFVWRAFRWQSKWPLIPCHGVVVLAVLAITLQCLANPEETTSFFGMIPLRSKYYPLALVGFFALFNGEMALGDFAAVAVGYAHERLGLSRCVPSDSLLTRWESARYTLIFGRHLFGGRWVSVRESFGGTGLGGGSLLTTSSPARAGYTVIGRPQGAGRQEQPGTQFAVFSGRGNRLGS